VSAATARPVFKPAVPLDAVTPRSSNHNSWDPAKLRELEGAIRSGGFSSVVLLRERAGLLTYEIIDGEHRCAAARAAGLESVPAFVYGQGVCDDDLALAKHIGHNVLRGDIDLAILGKQLVDAGGLPGAAGVAGVSPDWAASLMSATRAVTVDVTALVDEALGVDTSQLLERTPPGDSPKPTGGELRKLRSLLACAEVVLYGDSCEQGGCEDHDCLPCNAARSLDDHFGHNDEPDALVRAR